MISVFGIDTALRVCSGYNKIRLVDKEPKKLPTIMHGMLIPLGKAARYTNMNNVIDWTVRNDPSHSLLYIGTDALYLTFSGQGKNFHPMYVDWGAYNQYIYPNYVQERDAFIESTKPVVLADVNKFSFRDDYKKVKEWTDEKNNKVILYRYVSNNNQSKIFCSHLIVPIRTHYVRISAGPQ